MLQNIDMANGGLFWWTVFPRVGGERVEVKNTSLGFVGKFPGETK